ncbi:MAG: hypothetical protein P8X55_00090 [Desulfosarcinaceae bacterium]
MIYFKSKDLSDRLGFGLAKWKRWTREFLGPDPLGGLQSGYARQFNLRDAFRVFLGGILVSDLKYNIPESRKILSDLNNWLKKTGFYQLHSGRDPLSTLQAPFYRIYIVTIAPVRFAYTIRAVEKIEPGTTRLAESHIETYVLDSSAGSPDPVAFGEMEAARVLGASALYRRFLESLNP